MHLRVRTLATLALFTMLAACGDDSSSTGPTEPTAVGNHGITVLSPNGGETFKAGDSITVKWSVALDSIGDRNIGIGMSCGASGSQMNVYPEEVNPRLGTIRGKIASSMSGSCRLKIYAYGLEELFDTTDARFTVTAP